MTEIGHRVSNSVYLTIQMSIPEAEQLAAAVAAAGTNRNRFVRDWIRTLVGPNR